MTEAMRRRAGAAAALVVSSVLPRLALACPLCAAAIENDPVASAFSWTTLLMIAMPIMLVGSIGGWVFYAHHRAASTLRAGDVDDAADREAPALGWWPIFKQKESET